MEGGAGWRVCRSRPELARSDRQVGSGLGWAGGGRAGGLERAAAHGDFVVVGALGLNALGEDLVALVEVGAPRVAGHARELMTHEAGESPLDGAREVLVVVPAVASTPASTVASTVAPTVAPTVATAADARASKHTPLAGRRGAERAGTRGEPGRRRAAGAAGAAGAACVAPARAS